MLPLTHVIHMTTIRREQQLPVPGTVIVRMNEKVQSGDVLAEAEPAARYYSLDLARALGVPTKEAVKLVRRERGERIDAGDVLAGPAGVTRRTLRAPAAGEIVGIQDGRLIFEARGSVVALRAGFSGVVVATDGLQSVTLEATGALVQAVWGNGKHDSGIMRQVASTGADKLQPEQFDLSLRGAVLLAGMCSHQGTLQQAAELSIRGLILGSLAADLVPSARRLSFPVLVTEGFGEIPMNSAAFSLLTTNVGREVTVDGRVGGPYSLQRPEVIIPLPAARQVALPDEVIPINPGVRVRVIQAPHIGAVGVVREVPARAVAYPSGVLARSARVELEGSGPAMIPLANLEILQ
jgi:hypothetical protein